MKQDISVSVIIPAYNAESCLKQCIDSALSQTVKPVQVIVINDGSTDHTAEVAHSYDNQIVYLEQNNQGQGAARNAGLKIATGKFVAFLDADDYWLPGFLEATTSFLSAHAEAVAVFTRFRKETVSGKSYIYPPILGTEHFLSQGFLLPSLFKFWAEHDKLQTGAIVVRSQCLKRIGGMLEDLRISQDLEYWTMIATVGKWGFIPEPLLVSTSEVVAKRTGRMIKYAQRRKLCPTVEQWERRVESAVASSDYNYFQVIKGRVASGYAYAKIIGGDWEGARHIIKKYGFILPETQMKRLLIIGDSMGTIGWKVVCWLLRIRETLKG